MVRRKRRGERDRTDSNFSFQFRRSVHFSSCRAAMPRPESTARCCSAKECISCSRLRRDGCEIARRYSRRRSSVVGRRKRAEGRHVLPSVANPCAEHYGAVSPPSSAPSRKKVIRTRDTIRTARLLAHVRWIRFNFAERLARNDQ